MNEKAYAEARYPYCKKRKYEVRYMHIKGCAMICDIDDTSSKQAKSIIPKAKQNGNVCNCNYSAPCPTIAMHHPSIINSPLETRMSFNTIREDQVYARHAGNSLIVGLGIKCCQSQPGSHPAPSVPWRTSGPSPRTCAPIDLGLAQEPGLCAQSGQP